MSLWNPVRKWKKNKNRLPFLNIKAGNESSVDKKELRIGFLRAHYTSLISIASVSNGDIR